MAANLKFLFRTVPVLCVLATLVACSDSSDQSVASIDAPDKLGAFGVGHSSFTAIDAMRDNRSLLVDVWYPVDPQDRRESALTTYLLAPGIGLGSEVAVDDLPVSNRENQTLLVFSHGYGGTNTQSVELMEMLASHGFIVASPVHTGNSQSSNTDSFDEAAGNRVPDVSFVIDTMIDRSQQTGDRFYNRIDGQRVGVVGHSFGGMTAIGMAAGWAGASPDPRVVAIVPISAVIDAQLQSDTRTSPNAGFTAAQLGSITVPVMLIGGTKDVDVFIENNRIAFEQLTNSPKVYKVDIIGATHTHFANVCAIGNLLIELGITQATWPAIGAEELLEPYAMTCSAEAFPIEEAIRLQNLFVVSFFKRYLLGDTGYDRYLSSEYADSEAAAKISVK
ncbi:MAG: alpha/beta hydrolase [Halioglobus sp.]